MFADDIFTKDNLEKYLIDLSKEFKKLNGSKMSTEIILVGGASILLNYSFRKSTDDVDAIIRSTSVIKEAINIVGEKQGLPNGWLNMDFKNTESYSDKLIEVSKYYKTYSNILDVRIIDNEYLIAMKLRSGRSFKKDMSDIVGIMLENKNNGKEITKEKIEKAFVYLYDDINKMPKNSKIIYNEIFNVKNLELLYDKKREKEIKTKDVLDNFNKMFPDEIRKVGMKTIMENIDKIIETDDLL
jgi:hypothetical protein